MPPDAPGDLRQSIARLGLGRTERAAAAPSGAASDARLINFLRLVVACAGLVVYGLDPAEDPARRPLTYTVLAMFALYSAVINLSSLRPQGPLPRWAPWVDLGWITLLVAVSDGSSSIFFPLYLFAILCASSARGFSAGVAMVLASVVSFAVVGGLTSSRAGFELNRFLIRPTYLLILGYLISRWAGHEVRARERLSLLREVTVLSNPRFGIDRTIGRLLSSLRAFYSADGCHLVVTDARGATWMRSAAAGQPLAGERRDVPTAVREILLPNPPTAVLVVERRRSRLARPKVVVECFDLADEMRPCSPAVDGDALAAALDASSLVSVPFRLDPESLGRLYVSSRHADAFDRSDVDFLLHVLDHVLPALENVRLVDRLASSAADEERRRIGRDLHDSVIQPYLGLRLGLTAASQALAERRSDEAERQIERLRSLADAEIESLRRYVRALSAGSHGDVPADLLPSAVRRFCGRFADATGIQVEVSAECAAEVSDRLAAEVFQMVSEALSNVRRHTDATRAAVRVAVNDGRLRFDVENDGTPEGASGFSPRSLRDRAAALGGSLVVEHPAKGSTAVRVEIPL